MKKLMMIILAIAMICGAAYAENGLQIVSPEGAPALAVSGLKENVVTIPADTIVTAFTKEEADFIIAPVNAGATLFTKGKSSYRLAAVLTWGNLVFASQRDGFVPEDMNERPVTLFGENTVNAAIALYILQEKGIVPSEIRYLAGAKNTQELLLNDAEAIVMTAEPAVSGAQMKNEAVASWSLSDLYRDITGEEGFAQAGLFVCQKTLEEKPEEVARWIEMIRESSDRCETDVEAAAKDAVEMGILQNEKIAQKAIPNCHIRYVDAAEAKSRIEAVANLNLSFFGGALPADEFYYDAK